MSGNTKEGPCPKVPDRIVEQLLRRIFQGDLKPGEALPPLRELASRMDVDRTSLRIALERLHQLNLVSMIQGSGVVIKDYRQNAGLGFLRAVFSMAEQPEDPNRTHLLLQLMEFMTLIVPGLVGIASHRATPMQLEQLLQVYRQHLDHLGDFEALAELRTVTEDIVADVAGNVIVKLIYNSTRPMRLELNRRIVATLDIPKHVETHVEWIRQLLAGGIRRVDVESLYMAVQAESVAATRASLLESL